MPTALETLQKYWQHTHFRELQDEIIDSVLNNQDTLAILPTGGGKSICFQVPAMMKDGICLVISPLIALMKDQVANLEKRNIKAIALTGGIPTQEINRLLDNCLFGDYKFLYLSPERLQSDWILERIKSLPINLIAIDEAHCVSQWGHDFRPAYLKISDLKKHFHKTPFLALTATATPVVKEDIIIESGLKSPKIFQQSFERKNIAYMVFEVEDKLFRIAQILKKNPQPSILYVRNRKSCIDLSEQLATLGFSTTYYHGGLSSKEKEKNMQLWMDEKKQLIIATNAFGMGIDKANVKTVIHCQLPENIENYYQETGRAGRNNEKAFAALLTSPSDIAHAKNQFLANLPDKSFLQTVFIKLCSYLQIAYGEGINQQFSLNLNEFCLKYNFSASKTVNCINFLNQQGVLTLSHEFSKKVRLQFIIPSKEVIRYISLNPNDGEIIQTILRTYSGIHEMQIPINIDLIAKKNNCSTAEIEAVLNKLTEKGIIDYHAKNNDITIIFNEIREDNITINRVVKYLEKQNTLKTKQLDAVLDYVNEKERCKNRLILNYFGEKTTSNCGICSFCISKKTNKPTLLSERILELLKIQNLNSREIEIQTDSDSEDVITTIQELLEQEKIKITANNQYSIIK